TELVHLHYGAICALRPACGGLISRTGNPGMQLARHANQWRVLLCGALMLSALLAASTASASCYVKTVATGAADGSSWANATTLQDALGSGCSALFLAQGVYKPTTNSANRGASFAVANKS